MNNSGGKEQRCRSKFLKKVTFIYKYFTEILDINRLIHFFLQHKMMQGLINRKKMVALLISHKQLKLCIILLLL